ncbi:MAG: hypothetical protein ACYC2H_00365 [Thermoplasmatota archaeon]
MGNFACPQPATVTVALNAKAMSGRADVTVEPATVEFPVSVSVFGAGSYQETRPASMSVVIQDRLAANETLALNLTATFAGGQIGNCQGATPFPAAEGSAEANVPIVVENVAQATQSDTPNPSDAATKGSPATAWALLTIVLLVMAFRRRVPK